MKKDFSKFKVLGITLLVTMSSCVVGSLELNAETLRTYGFEFDITSADKTQLVTKQKRTKFSNQKFRINNLIESGRTHIATSRISIDHTPIVFYLRPQHYQSPPISKNIESGKIVFSQAYHGVNFQNRAGPSAQQITIKSLNMLIFI